MSPNFSDPLAAYVYGQTGIPGSYTTGLENFGFLGAPFGGVEKNYQSQVQFQQLLKNVLDQQIGAFNNGNNINALPFNMRSIFQGAAPLLTDPWYGIIGAPGMLSNGYQQGALPNNPSAAYRIWKEQASNYPDFPAPSALYNFTGGQQSAYGLSGGPSGQPTAQSSGTGGGGGSTNVVGTFNVPINGPNGPGFMNVNASDIQGAIKNASQGGNSYNPSGGNITVTRNPTMSG
jgi:hypothetical protein